MTLNSQESARTAIAVNIAKLTLLAALAPPVIAGIAQRAASLSEGLNTAAVVATTVSLGSMSAVAGALISGFIADTGSATQRSHWRWIVLATLVGTLGLAILSSGQTRTLLVLGWVIAQFGYSGAMAVLRVVLASALPQHRHRGAAVAVLGSYGGLVIPVTILVLFPARIWETTFGLALLSLVVPLAMLNLFKTPRPTHSQTPPETDGHGGGTHSNAALPRFVLLLIQFATNIVIVIYLSYHPLEMAQREGSDIPVQLTILVIACAVIGIISSTGLLIWRPALLARSVSIIVVAGLLLGGSLALRACVDSLPLVAFAALLSGLGIGLNSSALFAAALDHARERHGGKLMGAYSAAGAIGQVVGPVLALGVLWTLGRMQPLEMTAPNYRLLFASLAILPLAWSVFTLVITRRRDERLLPTQA